MVTPEFWQEHDPKTHKKLTEAGGWTKPLKKRSRSRQIGSFPQIFDFQLLILQGVSPKKHGHPAPL